MKPIDRRMHHGLYRSRKGLILGVCRGIAAHFDISLFWIRAVAVALLVFTGFWPITGLYLLAALVMKPEPVLPIHDEAELEFYDSYIHSRQGAVQRIKHRFENLERRVQRMEHIVTSAEYDWEGRFRSRAP
jgi:phage shock protein C